MVWIIILGLLAVASIAVVGFGLWSDKERKKKKNGETVNWDIPSYIFPTTLGVGAGLVFLMLVIAGSQIFYTQNPGQASVIVSFTGQVEGISYEPGLHTKPIWSDRTVYDTRNNTLSYVGTNGNTDNYTGGDVSGPQITFQDANGVSGNIDLNVRYSIRGDSVGNIYNEYKTQQEFVNATLAPEVRSMTREILSKYSTSKVYGDRENVQAVLRESLRASWDKLGVDIEEIYLQEVRYPDSVVNSFAQAQAAQAEVEKAKAEQEKAKIEAETNKIKAQALSEPILMEKLIEALRTGTGTYVLGGDKFAIGL